MSNTEEAVWVPFPDAIPLPPSLKRFLPLDLK